MPENAGSFLFAKIATAQGLLQEAVPPDAFVQKIIGSLTSAPVNVTSSGQTFGAYQVINFASGNYSGYALYYSFAVPADPNGYGIVMRIAAGAAGTCNAQLGTGWVHDSAGRNYNVDVTADYVENEPDGPGFYKVNGNDREKLRPGLQ